MQALEEQLIDQIKTLSHTVWESRAEGPAINDWLHNFTGKVASEGLERIHALYLLSRFMYFGRRQMRELLRGLYRDLFKYHIVADIRRANGDTTNRAFLNAHFAVALERTLFLGIGNPAESGCHLLYYFRQENNLPKSRFVHTHEIFARRGIGWWGAFWHFVRNFHQPFQGAMTLRYPNINHYVFVDDFCGSGHQATEYSTTVVSDLKALNKTAKVSYLVLFATRDGIAHVRNNTAFDYADCLVELDESFECFAGSSRYFPAPHPLIDAALAKQLGTVYGADAWPDHPTGYDNCQLLLGFYHNTPDNTLPIFWSDGSTGAAWTPMFRRYTKIYG